MSPTRRAALAAGVAGVAASALAGTVGAGRTTRQPVVYLPHGGGPWPFVELGMDPTELDPLRVYLEGLRHVASAPTAVLMISAHWEARVPTLMTSAAPPMLYDYSNFPPEAYTISWPAPGAPELAARVRERLEAAGIEVEEDAERGFDHGTFVPMMLAYPEAQIPTLQLSLVKGLDPEQHLALGRALAPLRDEGVFIVASGQSFHNMRAFFRPTQQARDAAASFDGWLQSIAQADGPTRQAQLVRWAEAPGARMAHPREEHLLPLMVAVGAAGDDAGSVGFSGPVLGYPASALHFG